MGPDPFMCGPGRAASRAHSCSVGTARLNGHIMFPYRSVFYAVLCSVAVKAFVAPCSR